MYVTNAALLMPEIFAEGIDKPITTEPPFILLPTVIVGLETFWSVFSDIPFLCEIRFMVEKNAFCLNF